MSIVSLRSLSWPSPRLKFDPAGLC